MGEARGTPSDESVALVKRHTAGSLWLLRVAMVVGVAIVVLPWSRFGLVKAVPGIIAVLCFLVGWAVMERQVRAGILAAAARLEAPSATHPAEEGNPQGLPSPVRHGPIQQLQRALRRIALAVRLGCGGCAVVGAGSGFLLVAIALISIDLDAVELVMIVAVVLLVQMLIGWRIVEAALERLGQRFESSLSLR